MRRAIATWIATCACAGRTTRACRTEYASCRSAWPSLRRPPYRFPPLALTDLYRDGAEEITPQLVDGGVHDNQGLEGLLDPTHPCTHLIVSDASGQMDDVANPLTGIANVIRRSNAALMDRVREEQYAVARVRSATASCAV